MEDTIAPTLEWRKKHDYEPPLVDQKTNRKAYRHVTLFENLLKRDEIERSQFKAAEKLEQHWAGAQGHDVRLSSEGGGGERLEYARTYHFQKLQLARAQLRPREWLALQDIFMGATLDQVGRKWRAVGSMKIARAQGLVLVSEALTALALHWGFEERKK